MYSTLSQSQSNDELQCSRPSANLQPSLSRGDQTDVRKKLQQACNTMHCRRLYVTVGNWTARNVQHQFTRFALCNSYNCDTTAIPPARDFQSSRSCCNHCFTHQYPVCYHAHTRKQQLTGDSTGIVHVNSSLLVMHRVTKSNDSVHF